MLNICLIKYDMTEKSGGERVASALSRELCGYFNVHLFSVCGRGERPYYEVDSRVNYYAALDGHERIRKTAFKGGRMLRKYVKKHEIDVLMSIGGNVNSFMWSASHGRRVKKIFCEHINLVMANKDRMNRMLRKLGAVIADRIVTLTRRDRDEYIKYYSLPESKAEYIYNWVDDALLETDPEYNADSKKIITVGRFEPQKGYDMLVRAAKTVFSRHPDWRWDIYGDGQETDKIREMILQNGLENNLFLMGTSSEIYSLYPQYSFYVMSSRMEGLPMVLLEAKANGLPIVSFDCLTGPSEIVQNNVNGYLVPPENAGELADKVCELIENPEVRRSFSEHAADNLNLFCKRNIVSRWVELISSLAGKDK